MRGDLALRRSATERWIHRAWLVLAPIALCVSAAAGAVDDTLGDFEKEVDERERSESGRGASSNDSSSSAESDEAAVNAIGSILAAALEVGALSAGSGLEDRRPGAPTTAFVRFENTYQRFATSDVGGLASRGELMLGFLGVGGEFIRYWEAQPDQSLEIGSIEGLFRLAPNRWLQLTLAGGSRHIAGHQGNWAHGGGFSVGIHPWAWLGVETDLRWSKVGDRTLGDYRGGLLVRVPQFPYLAVRAGYRAIQYQAESLDGPEIGLVGTW